MNKKEEEMVLALAKKSMRKNESRCEDIELRLFILVEERLRYWHHEINFWLQFMKLWGGKPRNHLEANPDDLSSERILELSKSKID
jgi:oxygen-independent coproporphyrinogen-3 oxidase